MSRAHGNARVDSNYPQALAECDRCGFLYNHNKLSWQFDWRGPNLQDLGLLICDSCMDTPQENGQRSMLLPPDPVPIRNARPRNYVVANNPLSPIGLTQSSDPTGGGFLGTLINGGGVVAAFDGTVNKPWVRSAYIVVSDAGFENYVAKNWSPLTAGIPSSLQNPTTLTHSLSSFTAYAPNDRSFITGITNWRVQGSNNFVTWTTLVSGITTGSAGETVSGEPTGARYQFHRFAVQGDGATPVTVAQVTFSVREV